MPFESRRADYNESLVKPWRPEATYTVLGLMGAVFVIQMFLRASNPGLEVYIFVIHIDWYVRGWTLITSTLAHGDFTHILLNGLFLFFFGPTVERVVGQRRFFTLFFLSGAISGVAQVHLADAFGPAVGALGASGAIMCIFGISMVLIPHSKILVYGILPVKMWIAGLAYAAYDVLGAFYITDNVGHFAHLSGMAIGLGYGLKLRQELKDKGLQLVGA